MSDRPNILVIHADQHRYDCLGAAGNPDVRTPNIDALVRDGVMYGNTFCTYPVCTPSRYSMLTGLYTRQHLGWTNHSTIPSGLPTFPGVLRSAGYRTAAVGKMHFTPTYLDVGFDVMLLAEQNGPGRYDDDYHRWLQAEGLCPCVDLMDQEREFRANASDEYWDTLGAMESDLDEEHHSTTWIAERALEQIGEWDGGGNMLTVGFVKPHHPFDPPAPWSTMYDPDSLTLLPGWLEETPARDCEKAKGYFGNAGISEQQVRGAMAMYYATISQIDHHVGRFIDTLRAKGLYENTLIVYTGDHGDFMGFHHLVLKGNHMYDPLVKIPFVVKFPGQERAGERNGALVSNIDQAPLILRVAGCELPRTMGGIDLTRPDAGREVVFTEDNGGAWVMARSASRKLLMNARDNDLLLFDLEADPYETTDVADDPAYAADLAQLKEALTRWALVDSKTYPHLDEHAPRIAAANVPDVDDDHRVRQHRIFQQRMAEYGCPVDPGELRRHHGW
jgi:arylsulfatase A-like enzyme